MLETITDITERKQAEETQRRIKVLAASNKKLENEIARRQVVEESLRQSERHQAQLLEHSRRLQEQLRQLSCQILTAQEALTNVARHAKASRVDVSIQKLPGGVCMKIKDDGQSFDAERVLQTTGKGTPRPARHEGTVADGRRLFHGRIRAGPAHHHRGPSSIRQKPYTGGRSSLKPRPKCL